eukprot:7094554-Pyramimonas_sp.AAC.1
MELGLDVGLAGPCSPSPARRRPSSGPGCWSGNFVVAVNAPPPPRLQNINSPLLKRIESSPMELT